MASFSLLSPLKGAVREEKAIRFRNSLIWILTQARHNRVYSYIGSQSQGRTSTPQVPRVLGWDAMVAHLPVPLSAPAAAALFAGGSHPVWRVAPAHVGDSLT